MLMKKILIHRLKEIDGRASTESLRQIVKFVLIFAAYFITAKFGLQMDAVSGFATLVWPPTGIALAALLLFGIRFWPAVACAAFLINYLTGASVAVAIGIAFGNTAEAVLGTYLLLRFARFHKSLDRLKDVISLIVFAAIISTSVSAVVGVTSLWLGGVQSFEGVGTTFRAWWLGDALGDFIVAPFILVWASANRPRFRFWGATEFVLLSGSLVFVGLLVLDEFATRLGLSIVTLPYVLFPFVVWAALRFEQRGAVTVAFAISCLAILGAANGHGPFVRGNLRDNLVLLHSFVIIVAITGLFMAAAISERKLVVSNELARRATAALENARLYKQAQEAIRARDEFMSIASHELKTPLTALMLQTQLRKRSLSQGDTSYFFRDKLEKIVTDDEKQLNRVSRLIDDMLDMSRINTGKLTLDVEEVELGPLIRESLERFSSQLEFAGCEVNIKRFDQVTGNWDRYRLEQVFINLLTNAMKYGAHKPIEISIELQDELVTLSVTDHGIGIAAEDQARVFQPFERASRGRGIPGLGLGLYIAKQITEAHGGTINVQSAIGVGSTFSVILPLLNG